MIFLGKKRVDIRIQEPLAEEDEPEEEMSSAGQTSGLHQNGSVFDQFIRAIVS